jgi:DNA polymerase-3 subunit epsilon
MRALYFDTETTGLRPDGFLLDGTVYPGKICQLAYIIDDDGVLLPHNYYFAVNAIEPSASRVTGLTVPIVRTLSQGKVFADYADDIWQHFASADVLIAHNIAFDERFLHTEFARLGLQFEVGDKGFCTMRRFAPVMQLRGRGAFFKMPSLEEFASFYGVTNDAIMAMLRDLYDVERDAHDARHDIVKMYLALDAACRQNPHMAAAFGKIRE